MEQEFRFVRVGSGAVVHIARGASNFVFCGAGAASHVSWRGMSTLLEVEGPATCKRCIKQWELRKARLAETEASFREWQGSSLAGQFVHDKK